MLQNATWITTKEAFSGGVPLFRRDFSTDGAILSATLYITAFGLYEAVLNGERVGEFVLAPGWTSYNKRLQYQCYDVTGLLQADNTLTVTLGNGWCTGPITWNYKKGFYKDRPALLCALVIIYADGHTDHIYSDETWNYSACEILESEIYNGEIYDSRRSGRNFTAAVAAPYKKDMLIPQEGEIVREVKTVKPVRLINTPAGETVLDFGQNLTGYVRFCIQGNSGDKAVLRHAEVLDKYGNFYTENLRKAEQKITFICDGKQHWYKPHFTFQGFRYVCIDAFPDPVDLKNFEAVVLCSDMKRTGSFSCSNPKLNQLYSNIVWGQMGNYVDVPTDCPQRDERLGWTGDAQVFVRTGAYNFDVHKFFKKWLHDLAADQRSDGAVGDVVPDVLGPERYGSAAWGDSALICPWQVYMAYGDKQILQDQFESAKAWVEYIRGNENGVHLWQSGNHYGDWLGLDAKEGSYKGATDEHYIASAFYAYSVSLLNKMGKVLGKDMAEYEALYDDIVRDFRAKYLCDGKPVFDTQTAHVLALYFDLTDNKAETLDGLVRLLAQSDNHLTTGFVGTPYLLHVLSSNGRPDLAYTVLLQEDYPSWLFSVNKGATTMWEHWDGIKPDGSMWSADMNSFNHYAYGAVGDWLYGVMCGINPDEAAPGYAHSILCPVADTRLDYAKASLETAYGTLSSGWEKEDGVFCYSFTVPEGTTATICVEAKTFEVGAGRYCVKDGVLKKR